MTGMEWTGDEIVADDWDGVDWGWTVEARDDDEASTKSSAPTVRAKCPAFKE